MSSYQSATERDLKHIVGSANPGVGAYNIEGGLALGSNLGRGGGAPNNFTLGYPHLNPTIRRVETVIQPRLPDITGPSKLNKFHVDIFTNLAPLDVGPGSYLIDKADIKGLERFKPQKFPQKSTNWASL